jgi:hypothetical protein
VCWAPLATQSTRLDLRQIYTNHAAEITDTTVSPISLFYLRLVEILLVVVVRMSLPGATVGKYGWWKDSQGHRHIMLRKEMDGNP